MLQRKITASLLSLAILLMSFTFVSANTSHKQTFVAKFNLLTPNKAFNSSNGAFNVYSTGFSFVSDNDTTVNGSVSRKSDYTSVHVVERLAGDNAIKFISDGDAEDSVYISSNETNHPVTGEDILYFSFDFKTDDMNCDKTFSIKKDVAYEYLWHFLKFDTNGNVMFHSETVSTYSIGKWYNVDIYYDVSDAMWYLFINDEYTSKIKKECIMTNVLVARVGWIAPADCTTTVYVDNLISGYGVPSAIRDLEKINMHIDFEQYQVGKASPSELQLEHKNTSIELIDSNKVFKIAHENADRLFDDNMISLYGLNILKETVFTFDVQNRNSKTGQLNVQLRSNNGASPDATKNLINIVSVGNQKITYLPEMLKITEDLPDTEMAHVKFIINPINGNLKIYNNDVLKGEIENFFSLRSGSWQAFDFSKTIYRFQNYVKATPEDAESNYVTDIIYDNIRVIQSDEELLVTSAKFFWDNSHNYINELKAGPVSGLVSLINKGDTSKNINVFMAYKSDGKLVSITSESCMLNAGETADIHGVLEVENPKTNDYAEILVWEDGAMNPILKTKYQISKQLIGTPISSELEYLYNKKDTPHPRVIATSDDFAKLRELVKTDSVAAEWADKIIKRADEMVYYGVTNSSSPYHLKYSLSSTNDILTMSRRVLDLCETLGLAHQLTGWESSQYSDFGCVVMSRASRFQDWNPSHFLDTAEMMAAIAIGYDWMYTGLDDATKQIIEENIYTKGLACAKAAYDGDGGSNNSGWWKRVNYNWNTVCNGGIAITAAAFADVYPELAFELSAIGINNIKIALEPFAPHGGYEEGQTYAVYSLEYLSRLQTTMLASYGTDFGVMNHAGLSGAGDFFIHVDGPTGNNNFHDSSVSHVDTAVLMWLSNIFKTPRYSAVRMNSIKQYNYKVDALDLLWYNPDNAQDGSVTILLDAYFAGVEFISMRSSFDDSDALYLSAHGGEANVSHSHIDGGTFVLDMFGERFVSDLGSEGYGKDGYFGDRRFEYYRARAEGHNTIVINPDETPGQSTSCHLPFERTDFTGVNPFAILDMTPAYEMYGATSAKRGYMLCDNRQSAVIRDEIILNNENENTIYWFMQTSADVSVSGNTLILTKNGKSIKAEFLTNAINSELSYGAAEPLPESNSSVQNSANNSYKRISFKTTAKGSVNITVKITPSSGDYADINNILNLSRW